MRIKLSKHRALDPVIATLLLVAIAVVGGTIIFVFSQDFFSTTQISGTPNIELIEFVGYDGRDVPQLISQIGTVMATTNSGGDGDGTFEQHERITVHVTNHSINKLMIKEVRFGGAVYTYAATDTLDAHGPLSNIPGGQYDILVKTDGVVDLMLNQDQAVIQPGQTVDIILALDYDLKKGRYTQFRFQTANGAVFISSVLIGSEDTAT